MENTNLTSVTEFIFLGLSSQPELQLLLFLLFLMIYLLILMGNLLIVLLILRDSRLHTPMYFFLTNLSSIEICFTSCVFPQMLVHFFAQRKSISYSCCVIQVYTSLTFGISECFLLSVMAYDRFVAIREPLRYLISMNWGLCRILAAGSWLGGFIISTVDTVATFQLTFCQDNVINHFFCEMPALMHLSCTDTSQAELVVQVFCIFTLFCPVTFIILSYAHIIVAVLRIRSAQGRRKAFSTCSSHLLVVILFYGNSIFVYMKPQSLSSPEHNKIASMFYVTFTPALNPLIYSFRNKEVQMALRKLLGKPEGA
ncbi:olfactory receptor 2D3-like [Notamacropus eugenii]|uniref:olfactory receptor 2D3-like n=1 Tax=Notamacropus eugenii TaxID=9315 RepID=UPI003B681E5D